ncbi:MAG: ATP-binding protein, partial [Pseudomonadota bacterium]
LVSAQRLAAWGDVARRIAHEIKNPLTPIQLSAERLKRKYTPLVGDAGDQLENLTNVIIRQTNDLRRIVDDFSKFARMPEPERTACDLIEILQDAVLLQENGFPNVRFRSDIQVDAAAAALDATLLRQALTNLLKNAAEATLARASQTPLPPPEIRIVLTSNDQRHRLTISDNGIGLPADRAKLFEPYVTHREGGTGLGLPIVLKIIEDHGGALSLKDAEPFATSHPRGAMAEIVLPRIQAPTQSNYQDTQKGAQYG